MVRPVIMDLFDNWTIKKSLMQSDVNRRSSRLLLGKILVRDHMLPYIGDFDEREGTELTVYDVDTQTSHTLVLKKWASRSYVLTKHWIIDFVRRRELCEDDFIGLRWEETNRRFEFSRLCKASEAATLVEMVDDLLG